jgi:CsoR family transcriptional regulator, copper-sensing transcriptional repressor
MHNRNGEAKNKVLNRLSIVEGHLKKVKKMVEEDVYCPSVIHQSQAIQAALKKIDEIILQEHLHTCVLGNIMSEGEKKEKLVEEIVEVFSKGQK